jgi:hypothetical protein
MDSSTKWKLLLATIKLKQYSALQNLDDTGNINRTWENIRKNIKILPQDSLGY